ncbi:ANR family transcriptional regulator [[Pasteurella] aerogenes]
MKNFKQQSELAAEIERAGDYRHAAKLWLGAASVAKKECNEIWAMKRAEFCQRVATKPF